MYKPLCNHVPYNVPFYPTSRWLYVSSHVRNMSEARINKVFELESNRVKLLRIDIPKRQLNIILSEFIFRSFIEAKSCWNFLLSLKIIKLDSQFKLISFERDYGQALHIVLKLFFSCNIRVICWSNLFMYQASIKFLIGRRQGRNCLGIPRAISYIRESLISHFL